MLVKICKCFDDQLNNDNTLPRGHWQGEKGGGFKLHRREHLVNEQRQGTLQQIWTGEPRREQGQGSLFRP